MSAKSKGKPKEKWPFFQYDGIDPTGKPSYKVSAGFCWLVLLGVTVAPILLCVLVLAFAP